jgi:hypothetical protein
MIAAIVMSTMSMACDSREVTGTPDDATLRLFGASCSF